MVPTCLNCGVELARSDDEFCKICLQDLDAMIDARELEIKNEVEMEGNINPFFESRRMTGGIRSQSSNSVQSVVLDESSAPFLKGLAVISVIMFAMVFYYLANFN